MTQVTGLEVRVSRQIQFVDKHVHHAYWVVFINVVIQALRQQCDLATVTPLDVSRHLLSPYQCVDLDINV